MHLTNLVINPQTGFLRSGWRVLLFVSIALLPRVATSLFTSPAPVTSSQAVFEVNGAMIATYCALIIWVALVSWLCLYFLEGLRWVALGYAFYPGWSRQLFLGLGLGALMLVCVVIIQVLGGGTSVSLHPQWQRHALELLSGLGLASVLLLVAAVFEEIVFRGYAFQTLVRDVSFIIPLLLLSLLFGLAHWTNPNRTFLSTANTVLAGIWLAVAYLKTRSLWFPTALHFAWNWTMGLCFGIPVSGLSLRHSILVTSGNQSVWLTGGNYGCEGGVATTLVFLLSTLLIWRANWLRRSPEMQIATTRQLPRANAPLKLGLNEPA